ncbi:hypothetical protein M409DRAFT_20273 [Zasmidium cellare ATCC 36951]|uniref:Uncharacterized protein n=1 Tax=Zasmidium cellare ATCC 36951 TaxID=1080233 RepID=A0A6A6CVP2_ZASCE|nr:uncharacterized protein M409DRAFT_20273 [Zasmidium cellare ATCC 36951]KAF2169859.1 hypothetical protein M409DRAFT_20273 [Zasmidium cellare ATCC 36951]
MARLSQGGSLQKPTKIVGPRRPRGPIMQIVGRLRQEGLWNIRWYEADGQFERLELHKTKINGTTLLVKSGTEHHEEDEAASQHVSQDEPHQSPEQLPHQQPALSVPPKSHEDSLRGESTTNEQDLRKKTPQKDLNVPGDTPELAQRFLTSVEEVRTDSSPLSRQTLENQAPEEVDQQEEEEYVDTEASQGQKRAEVATRDSRPPLSEEQIQEIECNIAADKAERERREQAAAAARAARDGHGVGPEELWEDDVEEGEVLDED